MSTTTILFIATLCCLVSPSLAFGAADFAYLNDKAFRHGDIENVLETLVKSAGGAAAGGSLLGFAKQVLSSASGGAKFSRQDVKRVYFGNWLRDYSQAMDIAGLSKLTAESLVLIVSILGFMTFGFATEEFEVTADRLGVYLPVEHIDNPKGYAEKEGDARQFHPKLRPPVDPRELEVDERTGMKNYMASDGQGWDTSTAHIRRTFQACIEHGRRGRGQENADTFEAFRLLGTGLHTLEDLLAHSNWCEIGLRKMGHQEVFCHVGEDVVINTPNGRAPPLVTGTFGGADFIYSLMGEATDHLSEASVSDLSKKMQDAKNSGGSSLDSIKGILSKMPSSGGNEKIQQAEEIKAKAYDLNPDDIASPEVQQQLFEIIKWRDGIYRDFLRTISMVPGLEDLMEDLTNALNAYVYTVLAPYVTPLLKQATGTLGEGSKAVINTADQYEVFDNPRASDPTHSVLSKDHFDLILNEPAGKIAKLVVEHSVNLIVPAWSNNEDPDSVIDKILEAFHHPYYASGRSQIQNAMFDGLLRWFGALGEQEGRQTIQALTKDSVRNSKNKRIGSQQGGQAGGGYSGGVQQSGGYSGGQSYGQQSSYGEQTQLGGYNSGRQETYDRHGQEQESSGSGRRADNEGYGGQSNYGSSQRDEGHGGSYGGDQPGGGYSSTGDNYQQEHGSTRRHEGSGGYGSRREEENSYTSGGDRYGGSGGYGESRQEKRLDSSGQSYDGGYGNSGRREQESYGNRRDEGGYGQESIGSRQNEGGYGGRESFRNRRDEGGYGGQESYETRRDEGGYGGRESYGGHHHQGGYGGQESYGESRREEYNNRSSGYGGGEPGGGYSGGASYGEQGYGSNGNEYSSGRRQGGYGEQEESQGYGGSNETFGLGRRLNLDDRQEYDGGGEYNEHRENRRREYGEENNGERRDEEYNDY